MTGAAPQCLDDLARVNRGRDGAGNLVISVPRLGLVCSFLPGMGGQSDQALEHYALRRVKYILGMW